MMDIYGMKIPEKLIEIIRTKEPLEQYRYLELVYPDLIAEVNRSDNREEEKMGTQAGELNGLGEIPNSDHHYSSLLRPVEATLKPSTKWAQWPGHCPAVPKAGYHASTGADQMFCPNCGLKLKEIQGN